MIAAHLPFTPSLRGQLSPYVGQSISTWFVTTSRVASDNVAHHTCLKKCLRLACWSSKKQLAKYQKSFTYAGMQLTPTKLRPDGDDDDAQGERW